MMFERATNKLTVPKLTGTQMCGRDGAPYHASADLIAAANAALVLGMPLLVTGDAGCGKTDFAFAAASELAGGEGATSETGTVLEYYVRSDTRARDLLYRYDTIRRFGDAQHGGEAGKKRAEDPRHYIQLEPLGEALLARSLRVVLIDEIDKAPRDLPNDLLRELDQGWFEIPEIPVNLGDEDVPIDPADPMTFRHKMARPDVRQTNARRANGLKPLVIITSNVERQLPDPFLRRCVFYHIPFPSPEELRHILRDWFPEATLSIDQVVSVFESVRRAPLLTKKPTTSELIGWFKVLLTLEDAESVHRALSQVIAAEGSGTSDGDTGRGSPPWRELPSMCCLIKLKEDLDRLYGGA